jgi:hypothetical protein
LDPFGEPPNASTPVSIDSVFGPAKPAAALLQSRPRMQPIITTISIITKQPMHSVHQGLCLQVHPLDVVQAEHELAEGMIWTSSLNPPLKFNNHVPSHSPASILSPPPAARRPQITSATRCWLYSPVEARRSCNKQGREASQTHTNARSRRPRNVPRNGSRSRDKLLPV